MNMASGKKHLPPRKREQPSSSTRNSGSGAKPMDLGNAQGKSKRPLSQVTCYKCLEKGHYANECPNPPHPSKKKGRVNNVEISGGAAAEAARLSKLEASVAKLTSAVENIAKND